MSNHYNSVTENHEAKIKIGKNKEEEYIKLCNCFGLKYENIKNFEFWLQNLSSKQEQECKYVISKAEKYIITDEIRKIEQEFTDGEEEATKSEQESFDFEKKVNDRKIILDKLIKDRIEELRKDERYKKLMIMYNQAIESLNGNYKPNEETFYKFRINHYNKDIENLFEKLDITLRPIKQTDIIDFGHIISYVNYIENYEYLINSVFDLDLRINKKLINKYLNEKDDTIDIDWKNEYILPPLDLLPFSSDIGDDKIHLRDLLDSEEFKKDNSKLTIAFGKDENNNIFLNNLENIQSLLMLGNQRKKLTMCMDTVIMNILYQARPDEVKLLIIDTNIIDLSVYNKIPHLLLPVITEPQKAIGALAWIIQEINHRYNLLVQKSVRDFNKYNLIVNKEEKLPQIVIIINEITELLNKYKEDIEEAIYQLIQKAKEVGIYLIIGTQNNSNNALPNEIKEDITTKITFDALDKANTNSKSHYQEDMLLYISRNRQRMFLHRVFISDEEIEKVVNFIVQNNVDNYSNDNNDDVILLKNVIDDIVNIGQVTIHYVQRKFDLDYAKAEEIIEQIEEMGIILNYQDEQPREVFISKEEWENLK